jgi:RimK family alpha-L-glutamate ligase
MRLAFLGSATSWYLSDLRRAGGASLSIEPVAFTSLRSQLGSEGVEVWAGETSLHDFDAVLVRTMLPASLEQVVFRMDALAALTQRGIPVVNPPKAIEAAVDKYLTTCRLEQAGLLVPRTMVCQRTDDAMEAFDGLGGDVVLKPLFGGEGRGIARLTDEALALRAFKLLENLGGVFYLQEFIEHEGFDVRVLIVGDQVSAIRRRNPLDWRTNVARGGVAEAHSPTAEELQMAWTAAEAIGAEVAGVDLLRGRDGRLYAIEVNAVPGWQALSRATGIDVASQLLDWLRRHYRIGR